MLTALRRHLRRMRSTATSPPLVPAKVKRVKGAGGVIWRGADDGRIELLVIHRPKYDDWSFAKGKRDKGETDEACALREVEEETGFVCALGDEVGSNRYIDHKGRPKRVRYWSMTILEGAFAPNDEVDVIRWVDPEAARAVLSYDYDREILDSFLASR